MRAMRITLAALVILGLGLSAWAAGRTAGVSIRNLRYSPASVRISVGDSVVWSNMDDYDHTVVADDGSFASGTIKSGQSFQRRFTQKGVYTYSCRLHPRMKGVVIVE